jgi:endonuclease/exonuclease/phosphatase (EEP) superfamily protein YafD
MIIEDTIIDFLVPISFFLTFIIALFLILFPFLAVKFIFKRKFNWWIIILCLMVAFGIYQAEVWAWWKFWEWGLAKIGEGFLSTF